MNVNRESQEGGRVIYTIDNGEAEKILQTGLRSLVSMAKDNMDGTFTFSLTNTPRGIDMQKNLKSLATRLDFTLTGDLL